MTFSRSAAILTVSLIALSPAGPLSAQPHDARQQGDADKNPEANGAKPKAKLPVQRQGQGMVTPFNPKTLGQNPSGQLLQKKLQGLQQKQPGTFPPKQAITPSQFPPKSVQPAIGKTPGTKHFEKSTDTNNGTGFTPPTKKFGGRDNGPSNNPNPVVINPSKGPKPFEKSFDTGKGDGNGSRPGKTFGGRDKVPSNPVVINPPAKVTTQPTVFQKKFEDIRKGRKQRVEDGGKRMVIEEPDKRKIFKQDGKWAIQHDETERLRKVAPNARFQKGKNGGTVSIIDRPNNVKVYSESDANGQLLRRYRRDAQGHDTIIIDNRRRRNNVGKNIAVGAGIGLGIVAGAAILNSIVDVPPPRIAIPRDKYVVEYEGASDEDVYEALSAPPVEEFRERYTLDQIRATPRLRERMRRVDLDDINFEFGSWDVNPSEYRKLDRVARAMGRVISRNPNEVFLIEGYTDAVGTREDNLTLSDRRAEAVAEVLSEQFQVPFENLTTQGYGEDYLKVDSDGPERLNRRVAVRRITPLLSRSGGPAANQQYGDQGGPPPSQADRDDDGPPPQDDRGDDQGNDQSDDQGGNDGPPNGDDSGDGPRNNDYKPYRAPSQDDN